MIKAERTNFVEGALGISLLALHLANDLSRVEHHVPLKGSDKITIQSGVRFLDDVLDGGSTGLPGKSTPTFRRAGAEAYLLASRTWGRIGQVPQDQEELKQMCTKLSDTLGTVIAGKNVDPNYLGEAQEFFRQVSDIAFSMVPRRASHNE